MKKKKLDKTTLGLAAVISLFLFLSGVFIGWNLNQQKMNIMQEKVESINKDVESFQTEFLLLNFLGQNATCPLLKNRLASINKQTYQLGSKLTSHEERAKFESQESLRELKRNYYHSLIRYWLLSRKMKNKCGSGDFVTVLYFFDEDCDRCSDQGFLLSYFKKQLEQKLLVFTLDASFGDPYIQTLEEYYNVTEFPSLVVGGETMGGFKNKTELRNKFCSKEPSLKICG